MNKLESAIESILFVASKPLTAAGIAKILEADRGEVAAALKNIAAQHRETGIVLLEAEDAFQFATNSANSTEVKSFLNAELREKLTDATVETLAIIAYRQPIARSEIEAIRGVNCQYAIRHLMIRGMIQKVPNPNDGRQNLYEVTHEFLQHLGIQSISDLPDFQTLVEKIKLPETPESAAHAANQPAETKPGDIEAEENSQS